MPADVDTSSPVRMYKDEIGATFTAVGGPATEEIDGLHLVGFEASVASPQPLTEAYLHSLDAVVPLPRSLTFDQLRPSLLAAGLPVDEAMAAVAALATPDDLATLAELIGEPIPLEYVIDVQRAHLRRAADRSDRRRVLGGRPGERATRRRSDLGAREHPRALPRRPGDRCHHRGTQWLQHATATGVRVPLRTGPRQRGRDRQLGVRATRPHGSGRAHDPARAGLDRIDLRRRRSAAAAAQWRRREGDWT